MTYRIGVPRDLRAIAALVTAASFLWMAVTSGIEGQILGVVFLALVVWSLYPERHLESSVGIILLLSYFQASLSPEEFIDSIFRTYGGSGLWIIVSGFVLAKAIEASGLGRRIALWIATSLGGRPGSIVLSMAIANLAVAPLSPSTTAKAFLLNPICVGLAEAFDVEKGSSRYGAALLLMAMAGNNIASTAFLTATVPNPISAQYMAEAAGVSLGWLRWLVMALPVTVLLLGVSWFLVVKMFKPDVEETEESLERIRGLREGLGLMRRGERIVAAFFVVALALWLTDGLHPYNSGLVSLVLSLVLFIPQMGVMKVRKFTGDIPWGSLTLFAASMFMAKAVGKWRALDPVAEAVFEAINLSGVHPLVFVSLTVFIAMLLHVAFTSTTVYATVIVPLVISLAQLEGLNPMMVALPVSFLAPVAVILPVNTIPNIVFHQAGYFSHKQMLAYGILLSLASTVIVLALGLPYWRALGLF